MKVIKNEGLNVLIQTDKGLLIWLDGQLENEELTFEWNKYIFHLDNKKHIEIRDFQDNPENYMNCCSIAEQYLIENGLY